MPFSVFTLSWASASSTDELANTGPAAARNKPNVPVRIFFMKFSSCDSVYFAIDYGLSFPSFHLALSLSGCIQALNEPADF
jgi:hypothetical protein